MTDKFDSFSDLLRGALGQRLAPADDMLGLFAEDVIFEFPFAPEGLPQRLNSRAALAGHMAKLGPLISFGAFVLKSVYPSDETVTFEFSCTGQGQQTGKPYDQDYVSVVTLGDGRITHYRDYWNPLVVLSALGGADAVGAAYAGGA